MAPAPAAPAAGEVESLFSGLVGTDPAAPMQSPVSWVMLAAARRQIGRIPTATTPAPAAVTTGQGTPPALTATPRAVAVVANAAPVISTVTLAAPNATTGAVTGAVRATDANGDSMTYRATLASTTKGTVAITTAGVFTYTPNATARHAAAKTGATTAVTTDTVTVTVTDAKGAATTQAVTVTISPVNTAPTEARATVGTPNATTGVVTGTITATDADRDALTYTAPASTAKAAVSINASTGAFTYTPTTVARQNAGRTGATAADKADSFTVTITDGHGGTTTTAVTVAVSPVTAPNAAPVIGSVTLAAPNATTGAVVGTVRATDANGDAMTYRATLASTTKGTVAITTAGIFTYTPNATARHAAAKTGATTAVTTDTVTVTVTDAKGAAVTQAVTVAVSPRNTAPTGARATVGAPNATAGVVTGTVTATDADRDALTYTAPVSTAKAAVSINASTGAFTYTPTTTARQNAGRTGATAADKADSFTVTVTDGHGGTTTAAVTVAVSPIAAPNAAPVIGSVTLGAPNATTGAVTGTVRATDANGDAMTYRATLASSTKGTVAITTAGVFTYTPTATARHAAAKTGATTAVTTDTVTVTVTDAKGAVTTQAVTVAVSPRNTAPTGARATVGVPNASTGVVTGTVTATDADRDALTFTAPGSTAKAAVSINASTGAFTYTPTTTARQNAGRTGATAADKADSFTVTVTDGHGGTTTAAVTVAVSPVAVNRAPVAGIPTVGNPNASTGVVNGTVKATDADGDFLTYLGSTTTSKGSAIVNAGGTFTYTPTATARHAAAKNGATTAETSDSFTVSVSDGKGGTATVPVTVVISPANAAPIAGTPSTTTNPTTGVVSGNVNAVDPDKDALTYIAGSATTAKGTATVTATGAYTYTPTAVARHAAAREGATAADTTDVFIVDVADNYGAISPISFSVNVSPFNTAPSARITSQSEPDPLTGIVTGTMTVSDADGDDVYYSVLTSTPKGIITFTADSVFTYTPTTNARNAAASSGATAADKTDAFTVTYTDEYGGTTMVPVTVAIAPAVPAVTVGFKQGSVSAVEGNSGSTKVPVTVQLSAASSVPVTVRYQVVEQPLFSTAATPFEDFLSQTGSVTIPVGQTEATFQVTVYGDTKYENDELVRVELTGVTGGVLDSSFLNYRKTVTIVNDDQPAGVLVSFKQGSVSAVEGNSGSTKVPVTVQLSAASSVPVTVRYQVVEQPLFSTAATPFEDFLSQTGSVTIPVGQTEATFQITVYGDTKYENDELVRVELTSVTGGTLDSNPSNYRQTVTIKNDDQPGGVLVSFKQGSVSAVEGSSGSTKVPVTVQLSAASSVPVTVRYEVVEQPLFSTAATPFEDFLSQTGSVTIPVGQTEATFQITVYGDTKYEADELVRVELTGVTGGVLDSNPSNYRQTVTIKNDDQAPGAAAVTATETSL